MTEPWTIETEDLRKQYGDVEAVRGLSLQVPAGSIYGFLGRNGAGKTTTLKVLLGMARPTSGRARVFGLAEEVLQALVAHVAREEMTIFFPPIRSFATLRPSAFSG